VPLNVEATIAKALEKVPADRFASAADFAKALGDGGFRHGVAVGSAVADSAAAGRWKLVAQAMTGVAAALALVAGWSLLRPEPPPLVARFESPFREGQAPIGLWETTPDGSAVVYVGPGSGGSGSQLWIRDWNALDARPIEGTEGVSTRLGATQLAVSPDGQEVAFSMGDPGPLRVVSLAGGPGRTLAEGTYGAAWSDDGWIYVTGSTVIERVRQTGGEAEAVTQLAEGESYHGLTQPLPGGKALLFTVWRLPETEIWSLDLGTGERKRVTTGSNPRYLPSGYLLFGTSDGALMAAPFDARRTELTRTAVPVLQGVARAPIDGNVVYTVSRNGTLLYLRGGSPHYEFVRVSRTGVVTPAAPGYAFEIPANGYSLRLSLDGTRVVFNRQVDGNGDVWIKTLSDGPEERITFDEAVDYRPLWAPDGETVTYFSGTTAAGVRVYSKRADGTGQPLLLLDDGRSFNQGSWSPDGTWLVVRTSAPEQEGGGPRDILAFRPGLDSIAVPLMASPEYDEQDPALSPDGAWLAYTSNETGRPEVYVRSYPNVDSTRVRVSTDGGFQPVWAKDGHELYFVSGGAPKQMMAARLDVASGRVTGRQALFDMPPTSLLVNAGNNSYDVSADGEWFLMARDVGGVADEVILVLNFFEELKRLVPN
jgi:serine/threonine-protein kinase